MEKLISSEDIGEFYLRWKTETQNQRPVNLSANRPLSILENQNRWYFCRGL
jgi:hypothetical protein